MGMEQWLIFVGVWFLAGIPLGPNAMNCMAVSMRSGLGHALWAVAGTLVAAVAFMAAVALGLGAVLQANALLFTIVKLAGAAYLIWMGVSLIRKSAGSLAVEDVARATPMRELQRAALISFSNPKAILGYAAVFSQFIDPALPLWSQLAVLMPTVLAMNALIYTAYAAFGVGIGRLLRTARRRRLFDRGVGGFYIAAGSGLAFNEIRRF